MPRPPLKRAKLNHPMPSKRVANTSRISPVIELQQKLAHKKIGVILTDSDDSDKLVTSKRNGRNRRGIPQQEIYASGGVGLGDVPRAHRSQEKQSQAGQKFDTQGPVVKKRTVAPTQPPKFGGAAKPTVNEQPQTAGRRNPPVQPSSSAPGSTAPTRLQNTPALATSILGTIKPRRRQPSIVQLLGNNDSSSIEHDDLDDFLPDDESTPLNHTTAPVVTSTPTSPQSYPSISRKRKLTPPIALVPATQLLQQPSRVHSRDADAAHDQNSEPELPLPRRSDVAVLRVTPMPDDPDIMAPPLSSSPLKSPAKATRPSPVKNAPDQVRKQPPAPSTSELQALMPTRRRRKGRLRTQPVSEFDIPADTNSDDNNGDTSPRIDSDNDLSFRAETRGRSSKDAKQKKAKPVRKPNNARTRGREKSTISPTKLVTPLKRPTAQKSAAKSSLSQQQPQPSHTSAASTTKEKGATYSSRHRDSSGDKENQPADMSDAFSGAAASPEEEDWVVEPSIEQVKTKPTREMQTIAKKFADVDEWEMEFEEVSLGGNSSPNRR